MRPPALLCSESSSYTVHLVDPAPCIWYTLHRAPGSCCTTHCGIQVLAATWDQDLLLDHVRVLESGLLTHAPGGLGDKVWCG